MSIIASSICYGAGGSNNWTDQLTEVSLAYANSIVYLKFSFDKDISACDEINIKITDEPGTLQAGTNEFKVCLSFFEYNEDYINLYSNSDVDPTHSGLIHREYTTYTKSTENVYTISTSRITNTFSGMEYVLMIGSYDNEYGTSAGLKVSNTIIECPLATRTITYDMNSGDGDPIVITVNKGDTVLITDIIPTKKGDIVTTEFEINGMSNYGTSTVCSTLIATKSEGTFYRFLGWASNSSAINPTYNSTNELAIFNDTTLYAVWEEYIDTEYENNILYQLSKPNRSPVDISYTVTINPNNEEENTDYSVGKKTEYIFLGWVYSSTSTDIIDEYTEYTEATTVYALWETISTDNSSIYLPIPVKASESINSYVVTLNANGGTLSTEETDITSIRNTSYTFSCWSTDNTKDNAVDLFFTPTEDTTLYAIYDMISEVQPINLPIATKDNYIFTGWNEKQDSGVNIVQPYIPSAHITLYAHFVSKNKLKMHIYHNGKWHHIIM